MNSSQNATDSESDNKHIGWTLEQFKKAGIEYILHDEAAPILRKKVSTLARWRSESTEQKPVGPRWHKFGKDICYNVADLEAYIDSCQHPKGKGLVVTS